MKALTQSDIDRYRQDIERNGVQGAIRTYADLLEKGYGYAGWAKGVAEADSMVLSPAPYADTGFIVERYPQGTVTGRSAMLFMKDTAGKVLTQTETDKIRIGMAQGYLDFLDDNLGRTPRDVDFEAMRKFHRQVFERHGLGIKNWTLETPMKLIGHYEGKAVREKVWEALRETQGDGFDALAASASLYNIVRDYADGSIRLDGQGRRINVHGHSSVPGLSLLPASDKVRSIDRADAAEARQWLKDVSLFLPLIKAEAQRQDMPRYAHVQNGQPDIRTAPTADEFDLLEQTNHLIARLRAGNKKALADFTALPEMQAAAEASRAEAQMLLRQNPHLAEGLPPNRFNRPEFSDMPPQVQKLYAEGREKLQEYYQERGIRYGEDALDNTAMALAAEGYRNRMRSVTMVALKDGQVHIGDDTAPDFRMASLNAKEAEWTAVHESMVRAQETEHEFARQTRQQEAERMAESRSHAMRIG